jgi:hypothetical protein
MALTEAHFLRDCQESLPNPTTHPLKRQNLKDLTHELLIRPQETVGCDPFSNLPKFLVIVFFNHIPHRNQGARAALPYRLLLRLRYG